ncbi:MAG: 6-bladed beta-propeller [Candidatus Aminicenantaceae bacterium]
MRKFTGIALSLLLILGIWGSLEAQKIKTVDGVKIIQNGNKPSAPKGVPTKFTLTDVATIGYDDDPDKSLAELGVFVVAENGKIYVTDIKERKVKVFDADGSFVSLIGREGQGPGEFTIPGQIQISPDNELMVEDGGALRMVFFTLDGEFIRNLSMVKPGILGLSGLIVDEKGNFAGRKMTLAAPILEFETMIFDKDLNELASIDSAEMQIPIPGSGNKMNILDFVQVYLFNGEGNLMYGVNRDYEIKEYDLQGKHTLSILKDYKPVKVTQEDIEKFAERMAAFSGMTQGVDLMEIFEFPEVFPPYQGFFLDDQGRIFVRTWEKGEGEDEYWTDVFDKEGRFFTRFVHKSELSIIDGDTAYGVEENEEGFRLIKRYSVTWSK